MLTLKRFAVRFLVSKKVIVFPLFLSVFFWGGGGRGEKEVGKETMLTGRSGVELRLPGS